MKTIKKLLFATLMGCMTVQGFAQVDKTVEAGKTFTISSATDAIAGSEYRWFRDGDLLSGATGAAYSGSLSAPGTYLFLRQAKKADICDVWMSSNIYIVEAKVDGVNQPQGGCTFTQPAVVGTFKNFPKDYGPGTYVTLTDDRDYKNYTVVKIGGYWVMAQNLNYQMGLSHKTESKDPSTVTGSNPALIGHFWCPGGFYTGARTSTLASCDVWGALYSWETAMSFNGLGCWSTDANVTYCTGAANTDYCKMNWGRSAAESGSDGRGICPENWHVPTDFEWGVIFDGMESPVGTSHQTAVGDTDYGTLAGRRARAKCYVADETEYTDSPYLSDTQANWYYKAGYVGTDEYGFRALPAGTRQNNGSYFVFRGAQSALWSSTAHSAKDAYAREFGHHTNGVWRGSSERSTGRSVRCMRDS